jgi:pimeloyl-ACP methyl ester carboxylesterase
MIRRSVKILGKETVYWERNPDSPVCLVMLHGFRGNHMGLTELSQNFDGFRLILPDLPGYGESEPLRVKHTLNNYAHWLDEFVTALGLEEWVSWSHSYSGSIGLIQAATGMHRPAAVVSVSLATVRKDFPSQISTFYYWLGEHLPVRFQHHWVASRTLDRATGRWLFQTVSTKRRRWLMRRGERGLPMMHPRVVIEEYMSSLNTPLENYARRVDVPVLIIAGARDVIVPLPRLEQLVEDLPDGKLAVMPDQGHLAPIERPTATATITKRWLAGLHRHQPASRKPPAALV